MNQYIYGIDIGGTNIKIGLFLMPEVSLVKTYEIDTPAKKDSMQIFNKIIQSITKTNHDMGISINQIMGLGLAVPCPVKNGFVSQCANLSWENIHVINQMKKALPEHVNVVVSNDANSAAYGENMILEKPYQNAIFYTLGTGVGGGIILNGNIYEGTTGMAGEIGHMKIFGGLEDQPCGCGAQGCLEQVCGNQGIVRFAKQMLTNHESLLNDGRELSVKHIFEAAQLGDSVATSIVNRVAEHIAVSASVLAVVLDPEAFIIGGGIAKAGRFLIDKIEYYYKQNARFSTGKIPFVLAKTQNEAGIYGAAQLAKKKKQ